RLASGHLDGTITISGTRAGGAIVTLPGQAGAVTNLAWSPDGTRLALTSRNDFSARVWEVAPSPLPLSPEGRGEYRKAPLPSGERGRGEGARMVLGPLRHSHEVTALAWEPDGQRLATGSADETIKIWNATTGSEALTLRGHRERI